MSNEETQFHERDTNEKMELLYRFICSDGHNERDCRMGQAEFV